MLIIREDQMKALEAVAQKAFEAELLAHLTEKYGPAARRDRKALVQNAVERSERYAIVSEKGVATFAELMIEEGLDFDSDPARPLARATLTHPELPEAAKLEALRNTRPWRAQADLLMPIEED